MIDIKKFNFKKEHIIPAASLAVVTGVLGAAFISVPSIDNIEMRVANAEAVETEPVKIAMLEDSGKDVFNVEWRQLDYPNPQSYNDALASARNEAVGIADVAIEKYSSVISDEQKEILKQCETGMIGAKNFAVYDGWIDKFDSVVSECEAKMPKRSYSSGGGKHSGYGSIYNFKKLGILYDNSWRYSYYSSNVLHHKDTHKWQLGDDGLYRENGKVVVASDAYPNGTVLNTELFGEVIVRDNGVGRKDTLDVYTAF